MLVHPGRCLWRRFAAACLALWFLVITADPTAVHTCPMHDGSAALMHMRMMSMPSSHAEMSAHDHASHRTHVAHDVAHVAQVAQVTPSDAAPQHGDGQLAAHACRCIGQCCATSLPLLTTASIVTVTATRLVRVPSTGRPDHEFTAAWVDFILPFSTAPPAIVLDPTLT